MEESTNKELSEISNEDHCLVGLTSVDKLQKEWKNMEESLSSLRSQVTAVQQQLRALEKTTKKEMRVLEKDVLKVKIKEIENRRVLLNHLRFLVNCASLWEKKMVLK